MSKATQQNIFLNLPPRSVPYRQDIREYVLQNRNLLELARTRSKLARMRGSVYSKPLYPVDESFISRLIRIMIRDSSIPYLGTGVRVGARRVRRRLDLADQSAEAEVGVGVLVRGVRLGLLILLVRGGFAALAVLLLSRRRV